MTHLLRYLEDHATLYPEQLQEALRRQEIYGGSLDTALLELRLLDAHTLDEILEQACGMPTAPAELIDNGHERPWDAVPAELAAVGWAQPLVRRGDDVLIAVHPDMPDDLLGSLYRRIRRVKVMVTPECCLQKLAAERQGSVVPQRYAVVCVAYLSSLKRRPSVSGVFDLPDDLGAPIPERAATLPPIRDNESTVVEPMPAADSTGPIRTGFVLPVRRRTIRVGDDEDTIIERSARETTADFERALGPSRPRQEEDPTAVFAAIEDAGDSGVSSLVEVEGVSVVRRRAFGDSITAPEPVPGAPGPVHDDPYAPQYVEADGASQLGRPITPSGTEIHDAPLIHYTERGTLINERLRVDLRFDEADLIRRIASARAVLEAARTRDSAIEAMVAAAMVVAPRVGVFRVRDGELMGLSTPKSRLPDLGGKVVPLVAGSPMAEAVAVGRWMGEIQHPDLLLAVGRAAPVFGLLRRIDVRGRPVMVLYVDHDGREFLPAEASQLDELCSAAGNTFEAILKLRRAAKRDVAPPPASAPVELGPHTDWAAPGEALRTAYGDARPTNGAVPAVARQEADDEPEPPAIAEEEPSVRRDVATPSSQETAPRARIEVDLEPPPRPKQPPAPRASPDGGVPRDTQELAPGLDRVAVPDDPVPRRIVPPVIDDEDQHEDQDEDQVRASRLTWHSSPPPPPIPPPPPSAADDEDVILRPRVPTLHGLPALDPEEIEESASEIISLATPLAQSSVRGRIALEDEDWVGPQAEPSPDSLATHVDALLEAMARGEERLRELRDIGDLAWQRLAARFPGPLDVLRRDLRSLPPPSAHGPIVRAAITAGRVIVPYLLDLFEHDNPDVRFYSAFIFQELRDARCARPLGRLAFDPNGDVRVIAMRVLETYARADTFAAAAAIVRERLDSGSRSEQLYAARAVGTLRDVEAIATLVELLSSKDRFIQEAALESLCSITGQQHGLKPHRWKSWYTANRDRHRVEWIIESLRHRDLPVRRWAADELVRVTGHRIPFSPMGDRRSRDVAAQAWQDWWDAKGRAVLARTDPTPESVQTR